MVVVRCAHQQFAIRKASPVARHPSPVARSAPTVKSRRANERSGERQAISGLCLIAVALAGDGRRVTGDA